MADDAIDDSPSRVSDDSSDDSSDSEAVELLVTGRERRKTAGNRYNRDAVAEEIGDDEDPDEVALLFADAEDGVDEEFKSDAEDEDEMSSSDDDDQGPNAGADEMEGEKELDKQRKDERAKKRKADMALTSKSAIRKRPRIDPSAGRQAAPAKPSKKKERVTWLPDQDASGRTSLRKQTIAHREETLARLKESEAQSRKLRAMKEKRDKERAKDAPKELTQADRLEEAARIERRNAKSLNRWEAMEKKRSEEQAAKLAALKDRKLKGAVLTWWSGKAKWRGPRTTDLGKDGISPVDNSEPKKRGRKTKAYHEQMAAARGESITVAGRFSAQPSPTDRVGPFQNQTMLQQPPVASSIFSQEAPSNSFVSGVHDFANMQTEALSTANTNVHTPISVADNASSVEQDHAMPNAPIPPVAAIVSDADAQERSAGSIEAQELATTDAQSNEGKPPKLPTPAKNILHEPVQQMQIHPSAQPNNMTPLSVQVPANPLAQPIPIIEEYTTKNLLILDKFDELSDQARQDNALFFNTKKMARPVQHRPELCPITQQLAKYRDPATGIGYANIMAYKVLQELKQHGFTWSGMLGCYVGREGAPVARGMPEGYPG